MSTTLRFPAYHCARLRVLSTVRLLMDRPQQRDVVHMLMSRKPNILRDVSSSRGVSRKNVEHHVYACPRGDQCRSGGTVMFEKGSGYSNPFKHLRTCVSDGDDSRLFEIFYSRRNEKRQFGPGASSAVLTSATKKEQAMHCMLRFIVLKSMPISYVEDPIVRSFSKLEQNFSIKFTKSVIFKLTELVEQRIARILASTMGAIVHDGWTSNGTHYFAVFASFMRRVQVVRDGSLITVDEHCMPLLGVSPLAKKESTEDSSVGEAESFDADTHIRYLDEIFKFYSQDVYKWTTCSIADNCAVNKRLAFLLNVPHVGCMSHKLNSEVKEMVQRDASLARTIDSIHETMTNCKRRLKNRAMLRNLTHLAPVTYNETRWSGIKQMLNRFVEIRQDLIAVADMDDATVSIDRGPRFEVRVKKYSKMLTEIDTVTLELQKRGATLSDCRYAVNILREVVEEGRHDQGSVFFGCRLASKYLAPNASTVTDPHFESGVVKIQNGNEDSLTIDEKNACEKLRISRLIRSSSSLSEGRTIADKLANGKRRCVEPRSKYRNCGFILGSAAEVEGLWSVCNYVLTNHRKSMTPLLFECLIFLKTNKEFWDLNLVTEAMRASFSERSTRMVNEDSAQGEN
eukprot:IDg2931t1